VSGNETVRGLIDEVKSKFVELKNSTILAFILKKSDKESELDENDDVFGYVFDLNSANLSPKNKIPNLNSNEILIL
jgi:hypothetical protein